MPEPIFVGWLATFACMLLSLGIAAVFLRENALLFTVMVIFAFSWALLLPYYGVPVASRPELVEVYTKFSTILIGGLLLLHAARVRGRDHLRNRVVIWQLIGLGLLLVTSAPSIPGVVEISDLTLRQADLLVGVVMGVIGFAAIAQAVLNFSGVWATITLAVILLIYILGEALWAITSWDRDPHDYVMESNFAYFFAAIKSAYTVVLGGILAYHRMPPAAATPASVAVSTDANRTAPPTVPEQPHPVSFVPIHYPPVVGTLFVAIAFLSLFYMVITNAEIGPRNRAAFEAMVALIVMILGGSIGQVILTKPPWQVQIAGPAAIFIATWLALRFFPTP
jgi:hypothetical protein